MKRLRALWCEQRAGGRNAALQDGLLAFLTRRGRLMLILNEGGWHLYVVNKLFARI